jgi:S-adenosylmethionine decarboxylase
MGSVGTEYLVDAFGCRPEPLRDDALLAALLNDLVGAIGLTVIQPPIWHRFDGPGGVTGLAMLSESHLTCHTWPEDGRAVFNLFHCGHSTEARTAWQGILSHHLGADEIVVTCVERGVRKT